MKIRSRFLMVAAMLGALVAGCAAAVANAGNETRSERRLMDAWKFHRGAASGAEAVGFDDHAWQTIALPHTWNARDGQDGGGNYFRGDGWYRRRFSTDAAWRGRRVFLQFDGANRTAEVFLNGRRLGRHRGGFARFRFDITDALKAAGENLLAVRVNNDPHDNMIPVSADYTFYGGLYRAVSIVTTDPVHVDLLDYASPGVFVRQANVTPEAAQLQVRVKLANDAAVANDLTVRVTIVNAAGETVAATESGASLLARARGELRRDLVVMQPHLWDGQADPYLYQVRTKIFVRGRLCDEVDLPLGLRFFSVDAARGFFLNGHPLDLHGVCRHQSRPDKGWAISEADEREDFGMIEELGATTIRESHYQQSQFWNDLADRRGMVLWAELAYVNDTKDNPEFFANAEEQLRELIRQNYHHPAIFFWSIGNETFVRDPKTTAPDTNDRLLRELAAVVREEDDTRLSTYASNGDVREPRASHPDIIAFNHYFGWYDGTLDDFAVWLDQQHAARPDLRTGMSEFGAGANPAQHEEPAHKPVAPGPWHPEEWQARFHEVYWQAMAARPWLWGKYVWCMFDFASDGRNEGGTPGRNDKGLVTADRKIRKDAFYWYQANWSKKAVLHITSRRFTPRTRPVTTVKIYSNAEAVELAINGVSHGTRRSTNRIFLWPGVTLAPGENKVEATARRGGQLLTDRCVWVCTAPATAPKTP
jgi:beta-galactosidase